VLANEGIRGVPLYDLGVWVEHEYEADAPERNDEIAGFEQRVLLCQGRREGLDVVQVRNVPRSGLVGAGLRLIRLHDVSL